MKQLEMVCTCGVDGFREAEERRLRVAERMKLRDMRDLTSSVVMSLSFDFGATDSWIDCDMWFGVGVLSPLGDLYAMCDMPEDGLVLLWEEMAKAHPERVSTTTGEDRHRRVAARISTGIFGWYEEAHKAYEAHREAAHKGPNDCPPCEDCTTLMDLYIAAKHTLERQWGARDLDPSIDFFWR